MDNTTQNIDSDSDGELDEGGPTQTEEERAAKDFSQPNNVTLTHVGDR